MIETRIIQGDALAVLKTLPSESASCCVTSPPYWGLRDYGVDGQFGLESSLVEYVARMVTVFGEVRRVLRDDGTLWLNLGDSYNAYNHNQGASTGFSDGANGRGHPVAPVGLTDSCRKPKDLIGIPWRVAFALQSDGWWLRSDIIWHKSNPMPESVTDRPTKAHEYVFLMAKSARYYYDAAAIAEPSKYPDDDRKARTNLAQKRVPTKSIQGMRSGSKTYVSRNARSVWTISTQPYRGAHFAVFPEKLVTPCVLAGCPAGGLVLDPFGGSGTTGLVANRLGRAALLIELNPEFVKLAQARIGVHGTLSSGVSA
jgi:DNA modification methylase